VTPDASARMAARLIDERRALDDTIVNLRSELEAQREEDRDLKRQIVMLEAALRSAQRRAEGVVA